MKIYMKLFFYPLQSSEFGARVLSSKIRIWNSLNGNLDYQRRLTSLALNVECSVELFPKRPELVFEVKIKDQRIQD
ncbi:uncharacterized protein isoform X5 [Rhodnius prolixus]|uniref:uncharacterized protein isoform X5 n=1 Tax=Rhodnius prolixus TaxID=13249 RepID=UPI003D18C713